MSDLKCILYREKDGIGWITLNRPEVLNALNIDLLQEAENLVAAILANSPVAVRMTWEAIHRGK